MSWVMSYSLNRYGQFMLTMIRKKVIMKFLSEKLSWLIKGSLFCYMCRSYENVDHLKSLREAVEEAKVSVKKAVLRSISDFKAMKGNNTTNGQCIWICGCIENLNRKMIRLYLGCDAYGSKTYNDIGTKYKCSKSSCTSRTSTSVARFLINEMFTSIVLNMNKMIFQFDLVDITGSWKVTLFSDDASKVLGIKADKLYRMEYEDREKFYAQAAEVLAKKTNLYQVHTRSNICYNITVKVCMPRCRGLAVQMVFILLVNMNDGHE
ncbi:hypothetical protein Cgig2_001926 [Carnegiea gigantea]|uniref:Replication factor A C-terminal domain-containing protein n=1 Tax=Carnegiea gigantea TaxID=171969 RepID=A0A9Q1QDG2_9CARY|nr:hypothetical protein Cgig2_001926 [Carnegiea gigantea]